MFGQTENQTPPVQPPVVPPAGETAPVLKPPVGKEIYIMPEKFIANKKRSSSGPLILVTVILVLVVILTMGYLLYDSWQRNQQPLTSVVNVPAAIVPPQPEQPTPPAEATPTPAEMPTTTESTTPAEASSTASTSNPLAPPATLTPPPVSLDSDADSLTDLEEAIAGINAANPDTDGDGYKDGNEVLNGFDPLIAGSAKLNVSTFIAALKTNFVSDNFQTLYPKVWQVSLMPDTKQALITAQTGEIIRISVRDDLAGLSALTWYVQEHPEVPVSQLKIIEVGDLAGIYTPNGLTAYLNNGDRGKFYVFEYLMPPQAEFRYPMLFAMVIKQFKPVTSTSAAIAPATSSASTTASSTQ